MEFDDLHVWSRGEDWVGMRAVFDQMLERNVVSWNVIISSYLQNQQYMEPGGY